MVITDDRWTCPDCDRTFAVEESFGQARTRLAAVRATHAVEHRSARGAREHDVAGDVERHRESSARIGRGRRSR